MSNYKRSVESAIWSDISFVDMPSDNKVVYFLLLTGEFSSDSSAFTCSINNLCSYTNLSRAKVLKILKQFEEEGRIKYDYNTQEVLVVEYFRNHEPTGGLTYEMFSKDLKRIRSTWLLEELAENAKRYNISIAFFAALQDYVPNIKESDYKIKASRYTSNTIRTAAAKGRAKSGIGITEEEREKLLKALDEGQVIDPAEELPF